MREENRMYLHLRRWGTALAGTALAASLIMTDMPPASADPRYRLVLVSLSCGATEDWLGPDEAYLKVNGFTVWGPWPMKFGDAAQINRSIPFSTAGEIRLYDQDIGLFDPDDLLGVVTATPSEANQGERHAVFRKDGALYAIRYKVVPF